MHELPHDVDGACNVGELPPTSCCHILKVSQINAFNTIGGGVSKKHALINAQNLVENVDFAKLFVFTVAFV
jgi:hypothetical protein